MALEDDILKEAHGKTKADRYKATGSELVGDVSQYGSLLRKAQQKVEKNHFRDRTVMLHQEKERKKLQREIGQDPYLDSAD